MNAITLRNKMINTAQTKIRNLGNKSRRFKLRVYNNADTTATYWITRYTHYDFRNVVLDTMPASIDADRGEVINPDSVLRMKNWVINNMTAKFKQVMYQQKYIDARV